MSEQHRPASDADSSRPTGRRRLLQALALGGVSAAVLPEKWVKPIIDTVIVPAHAQATITTINGIYSNQTNVVTSVPGNYLERFAGLFISSAHAQSSGFANTECVSFDCSGNPNVQVVYSSINTLPVSTFTEIFPNNVVRDFSLGKTLSFRQMTATPGSLNGQVTNVVSNAMSFFSLDPVPFPPCNIISLD
tara:strand:- start:1322 stop:1894 length:573 start_codon:yes stop_codon:yes gene_type:complete